MTASDAAFVPVTYTMPSARLARLNRRRMWRSSPFGWFLTLVLIVLNVGLFLLLWIGACLILLSIVLLIGHALVQSIERTLGLYHQIAEVLAIALGIGILIVGITLIRRLFRAKPTARVDATVTLSPVAAGLRVAAKELEHILKWAGIHELLAEPDGIVVVCGGLYCLVPDKAFATVAARNAFLDHVEAHLTPEARARSERELQRARQQQ